MRKYKFKQINAMRDVHIGKLISKVCNVSQRTSSEWMNIPYNSDRSIPSDHLRQIAKALDMKMEDLYTQIAEV